MLLRWPCMLAIAVATVCHAGVALAGGFRSSDVGSSETPSVQAVAPMSDLMRQRSGGRLFIGNLGASDQDSESFTMAQLRSGTFEEQLAAFAGFDLVGLCYYDAGPRSIYAADKAVRTPTDMKGLKIRLQTSSVMAEVMQALGA